MDLSHWVNLSADIKTAHTKKIYFGRYLWRLEYNIPGAHLITDRSIPDIQAHIDYRLRTPPRSSYYSYPARNLITHWQSMDSALLERIRRLRATYDKRVKIRTESDLMQVFAENEDDLKMMCELIGCYNLTKITYPKEGTEESLKNGVVFMGKQTNFKYKVLLRDGDYSLDSKKAMLAQLSASPDVSVPNQLRTMLTKKYTYLWGSYFYTNDDSIVTI